MRTTRALAAAGAAVAVFGLATPTAVARDGMNVHPSNIVALPSVIARGGQLTVTVDGCPNGGHMTSDAFPSANLRPVPGTNGTSRGTATVNNNASPGSHSITVNCSGRTLTNPAAFTVIGGVQGGLGGGSSTGATPTDMAIGGGLLAAALVGGGLFWMRRRSEKQIGSERPL
ncbi:hypothetical protein [Streptomyces sp. NBC_00076]|uniref:hypothetical protein n=1 Tax=Streptomyces sp. NBC_00076 TaxID=2975642 RepID=UPI0032453609